MRTKSAQVDAIIGNPNHTARHRVLIYDSAGSTTYELTERATSVEVNEDVDSARTATVRLFRSEGLLSLSPLATPDALDPFSGAPVVAVGRRLKVFVSVQPSDLVVSGVEIEVFDGFVDEVTWPEDEMEVICTDRRAKSRDTWIERERVYGLCQGANATKGAYIWKGDLFAIALNDLVVPSDGKRNGHYYKATTVTSAQGTTEPAWPTGTGATVVSGGVTFTEAGTTHATTGVAVETLIQQLIDDNGLSSFATLQTPVSPSWNIKPFLQERMSVWDAIERLAAQMGWTLRYEWNGTLSRYELTLKEPARSSSTVARTFATTDELEVREASLDVYDIRNVVRVNFSNTSVGGPQNDPVRTYYDSTDSTSVTKYGRRFMEVQEADTSNIDTPTEAARMADAIRDDLSEPTCRITLTCPIDPFLELGDRVTIPADGFRWDAAQTLAIASIAMSITAAGATSTFGLRGKPAARMKGWHARDGRADRSDVHRQNLLGTSGLLTVSAEDVPGGKKVTVANSAQPKDSLQRFFEFHVSSSASFTPSSSTLVQAGAADSVTLANLMPGQTYYTKVIPYTKNGDRFIRGEVSTESSFTAGYVQGRHVFKYLDLRSYPLNGDFESPGQNNAAPDVWQTDTGTFSTDWDCSNASPRTGSMAAEFKNTAVATSISSGWVPVEPGKPYELSFNVLKIGSPASGRNLTAAIIWYDFEQTVDSSDSVTIDLSTLAASWSRQTLLKNAPSAARWARVSFTKTAHTDARCYIDTVKLTNDGEDWIAPTLGTQFANYAGYGSTAGYRKDAAGRVWLKGLVQRTGAGNAQTIFTLPVGYRPASTALIFRVYGYNVTDGTAWGVATSESVRVDANGVVSLYTTTAGKTYDICLDHISFDTRQ